MMKRAVACAFCVFTMDALIAVPLPHGGTKTNAVIKSETYELNADTITYKTLVHDVAGLATIDLTGEPAKTITLVAPATSSGFNQTAANAEVWIKGGTVTFSQGGKCYLGNDTAANSKMILTDGATLTGCTNFVAATKQSGVVLALTNAAIKTWNFAIDNGGCPGVNSVLAGANATIEVSEDFSTEDGPSTKSKAGTVFEMAGAGSSLKVSGVANIGSVAGGAFTLGAGSAATFGTLNFGCKTTNTAGSDCMLTVSDATVKATGVAFAKDAGVSGDRVVISGSSATFKHDGSKNTDIFGSGSDCRVTVANGATLEFTSARRLFKSVTASTLEFVDGGILSSPKPIHFGYGTTARPLDCVPNRIVFGNLGSYSGEGINIYGVNNEVVVSNGLYQSVLVIGNVQDGCNTPTNVALVLQGTSPRVDATQLRMDGVNPRIRFELAKEGYLWTDDRAAPIVIANQGLALPESATFEADVSRLDPCLRGQPIPLISSSAADLEIPDAVLARSNDLGAAGLYKYSFRLSDDRRTLYLLAKARGLFLVAP